MDDMEEKLGNILNNPQMMQQIMSMAQAMGGPKKEDPPPPPPGEKPPPPRQENPFSNIDIAIIQKISGLAQNSNIDKRERALLQALGAYLSKDRVIKLEKAMRAAKIAKIASSTLAQRGSPSSTGR